MTPFDKRIVVWHVTGRLAGLRQIIGTVNGLGLAEGQTLSASEQCQRDGETIDVGLVASKRTYWLYKEVYTAEGMKTFDRRQR